MVHLPFKKKNEGQKQSRRKNREVKKRSGEGMKEERKGRGIREREGKGGKSRGKQVRGRAERRG